MTSDEVRVGVVWATENQKRSRKRRLKLHGIGVGKNLNVSVTSDSVYDSIAYDPVKTRLSESEAEGEGPTNRKVRNRTVSLVYSSVFACDSDNAIFT